MMFKKFCFAILLVLVILLLVNTDHSLATKILSECQKKSVTNKEHCFTGKVLAEIEKNPAEIDNIFSGLWNLAMAGKITEDPRIFSDMTHAAGMLLVNKNIKMEEAFKYCGKTFKQGCMHGVIMEYIDDEFTGDFDVKNLGQLCDKFTDAVSKNNCIHAVGHELVAKVQQDLPAVLDLCKSITTSTTTKRACESGVLMEYSKGTAGSGSHSDSPVGVKKLPCAELNEEYQVVCYASEGSYRQYNPGQETFATTYQYCTSTPYTFYCMLGVSERAIIATAENATRAHDLCDTLVSDDAKMCLESLIQVSKTQFDNKNLTHRLEALR